MSKVKWWVREGGWTFIEAILSVVIMSIMVLGLTIVLLAFKEHLDRSWAVRVMDQYGNDVIEQLTHELRNAYDVQVRSENQDFDRITIVEVDKFNELKHYERLWYADQRTGQIKRNHDAAFVDRYYPPRRLRRGESFTITRFKLVPFGRGTNDRDEALEAQRRNKSFVNATYNIELTLRYTRGAVDPGHRNWFFEKTYHNRVYVRNMNLVYKNPFTKRTS